ncbi:M20 peptidase aminoacylase family protein [Paenisporosarcina cavernae]|uniref:Amidohydrolase n=1 Tax=Paenisporosarcina cavernae TaxID=2320858 RepID=A0A385YY86_9BACL|nr:M20 peptidase aminoacylase family protein [Paenisporosarcina cavernae]AYC30412.1 amidohydrolase [Paenisporosarcina cavernae]
MEQSKGEVHQIQEMFEYLHQHPEVSWKEIATTNYISNQVELLGLTPVQFADCTGLYVDTGEGELVAGIRTDMDALWQEVEGTFQANHSCGHDAHMTIVFGTLKKLIENDEQLPFRLRFIFQPAEETGQGALKLIEHGVVSNLHYLFGLHLRPVQELPFGKASASIDHGASIMIKGTIAGTDAHAARPHLGINSIEVATSIVQHLEAIRLDPMEPFSVKMTQLLAGSETGNIIPGKAVFTLDLRAQSNAIMQTLEMKTFQALRLVEEQYGATIDYSIHTNLVAARPHPEAKAIVEKAIHNVLGAENCVQELITPGGEDFHFYAEHNTELKTTMIGLGCDLSPGLHHPDMTFNHEALQYGVELVYETIQELKKTWIAK